MIISGDVLNDGWADAQGILATQILGGLNMPYYTTPGGHDLEWETPIYGDYFTAHASIDATACQVILFETDDASEYAPGALPGQISAGELTWLEAQMAAAGEKPIIVATHYPLIETTVNWRVLPDHGGAELEALLAKYHVKAYLAGHMHTKCVRANDASGAVSVNGPGVMQNILANPNPPGLVICNVFADRVELDYRSADSPHERYIPGGLPVPYEPIIIYW